MVDQTEGREQPLRDDPLLSRVPEVEGYKVLEPCVLYAKVGEGGMGAVYRGRHLNLDIDVAVKCLKNVLAEQSPTFVTRFQREARIAASVHHQNLVQVYDISEKNGVHYLVMEYVRGETARERVARKKKLKEAEALKILLGAASGLAEAHAKRIVHRDIKPDNILISYDGTVKVSDLGLAKALEVDAGPSLTMGVMGTPQYMAPEQWDDAATVGPAADVWALGATFYYLLTGEHAIPAGSMQQIYRRVCVDPFPDVQQKFPSVSAQSKAVLERCVARDPKERFADCRELVRELNRVVAKDAPAGTNLSDSDSGAIRVPPLLSPPPADTLGHIRVALQDTAEETVRVKTPAPASKARPPSPPAGIAAPPAPASEPSAPAHSARGSRTPALVALVAAVPLLALTWFMIDRGGEKVVRGGDVAGGPPLGGDGKKTSEGANASGSTQTPDAPHSTPPVASLVETKPPNELAHPENKQPEAVTPAVPPPLPRPVLVVDIEEPLCTRGTGVIPGKVQHRDSGSVRLETASGGALSHAEVIDGRFELTVPELSEDEHALAILMDGEDAEPVEVRVICDRTLPRIEAPGLPKVLNRLEHELALLVEEEHLGTLAVTTAASEVLDAVRKDGEPLWTVHVLLTDGIVNTFTATATDLAGNQATLLISIPVDATAPVTPTATPPTSVRLVPRESEFLLSFSEPGLRVEIDGREPLVADGYGVVRVRAEVPKGTSRFTLRGTAIDGAGNSLPLEFGWDVQAEPLHPAGWEYHEPAGFDAEYRARRVRDPSTGIWFVLLPQEDQEGTETYPTYVAETEVTRAQWTKRGMPLNPLQQKLPWSEEHPITGMSWKEAQAFCLNAGYELPSRELWRKACLAGVTSPLGPKELTEYAAVGRSQPLPVGQLKPNAYGIYDMLGNVWEWCRERDRAVGGSFYSFGKYLSVDAEPRNPGGPTEDIGFRPIYRQRHP